MTRKQDGTLGHKVFRKKTHTDNYLHVDSHHHPSQKMRDLNTMAIRVARVSDNEHLKDEIDHLTRVFKKIGYRNRDIKHTIDKKDKRNRDTCLQGDSPTTRCSKNLSIYSLP